MRILSLVIGTAAMCLISPASMAQADDLIQLSLLGQGGPRARQSNPAYTELSGRSGGAPEVGEMAPDFELTPLKFYELGLDEGDITQENAGDLYKPVRLSDFQGKKAVVLIFGSYT